MSYDVTVSEWFNYTSNMGPFFQHFIGMPLLDMNGMSAPDADRHLTIALVRIAQQPLVVLQEFDASNGWGGWSSATDFLRRVRDDCRMNPELTMEVTH